MIRLITMMMLITAGLMFSSQAKACRDCPFPMRIAPGAWWLPEDNVQVEISTSPSVDGLEKIVVVLRNHSTGELIAKGCVIQRAGRKTINVQLSDTDGRPVRGYINYQDDAHVRIQVKFDCTSCSVPGFTRNSSRAKRKR